MQIGRFECYKVELRRVVLLHPQFSLTFNYKSLHITCSFVIEYVYHTLSHVFICSFQGQNVFRKSYIQFR